MVGGYDLNKYAKGPIQWHDTLEPKKTWYLNWTGVKFGDDELELDPTVMLPDTGTSFISCLLYTSPSPRDRQKSRMPSSA